ncbi:nucleotide exchange factor GrpE [Flavobacteriaceae bacterium]|nr:nucleotide exchange factor GrpE [Flavobacteriaceae bacterium]MDA9015312.1 nucleotide exchange factor GrpE [Flavobacteriaceae bacterium]MDC3354074.1 nucleotide exchange factor GrpE [Flavobacteriaceae bacterium]
MATKGAKTSKKKTSNSKKDAAKPAKGPNLESKIEELNHSLEQEKEKFLRLFAEFENFKKRTSKERLELFKTANQEVVTSLIPVLDDFNRANQQIDKGAETIDVDGFKLIYNKFFEVLKSSGLSSTTAKIGDSFDAEFHEAITQIPAPTDAEKGKIIDIVETGYQLGDRIIRYPKVVVGQ